MNLTDKQLERAFNELAKSFKAALAVVEVMQTDERVYTLRNPPAALLPPSSERDFEFVIDFEHQTWVEKSCKSIRGELLDVSAIGLPWADAHAKFDDWAYHVLASTALRIIRKEEQQARVRQAHWATKLTLGIPTSTTSEGEPPAPEYEKLLGDFCKILGI